MKLALVTILAALACASFVRGADTGGNVLSFRNGFAGIFPHAQPPLLWGSPKSIVWRYPLRKRSNASPLVVDGKVFVLDEPHTLLCLRTGDGQLLWQRENSHAALFGSGASERPLPKASWSSTYGYSTPTPVSDGQRIWCVFGHGVVACYDLDGNRLWAVPLDTEDKVAGQAVSPCLVDGVLVVGGKGTERLCGLDPQTGEKLWRTEEGAQDGSCVPVEFAGRWLVATSSGMLLEPRTGRILQRGLLGEPLDAASSKQPVNWGPTVAVENDLAIFHVHFQPDKIHAAFRAVRLSGAGAARELWEYAASPKAGMLGRMGNSPVLSGGLLYAANDGGLLEVLEARTGQRVYSQQLPRQSYASLTLAGGYLFAFGLQEVTVFRPGRKFEQVARFQHGFHDFMSSPVFSGRRLFFRDAKALWCIEQPAGETAPATGGAPEAAIDPASPSLADSAKTAPLIPIQEWLLLHDYTRNWIRNFSRAVEWSLACLAVLGMVWRLRGARLGWKWLRFAALAIVLGGALSFIPPDRFGNHYCLVAVWAALGGLHAFTPAQTTAAAAARLCVALPASVALGLLGHQLPVFLVTAWYVLTGKPL